jgi:multisubunit Na+/H+ antiporter MnhE subunit
MAFVMATGIIQALYMLVAGSFPYNSFLSGFISSVGTFVLAGLRFFLLSSSFSLLSLYTHMMSKHINTIAIAILRSDFDRICVLNHNVVFISFNR